MNDLVVLENINAVAVFSEGGVDDLLKKITTEAKSIVADVSTARGRKDIATMAHKVAKSKTYLDSLGKDLVSDWKTKSKAVDGERKKMRDTLDALKEEVRKPLTDYEQAEEERLRIIKEKVDYFGVVCSDLEECNSKELSEKLEWVKEFAIDDSFEEYANDAAKNKDLAITVLEAKLAKVTKQEQEQVELEKLRAESEKREHEKREETLRKEGEEKAKREAEAKAKEEAERSEREKNAAIQAKEKAESEAKEAKESAERKAEAAAQAERDRIEQERIAEEAAAKKREADKKHRAKINNAAVDDLMVVDLSKEDAVAVVTAIAKGQISHIRISY